MLLTNLRRIERQLFGNLIELDLDSVTWLRRAMAALWTTRRLIREYAHALKLVTRHVVCDCLQCARVERARDAVAAIGAAIQERLEMHSGNRAIFLNARL